MDYKPVIFIGTKLNYNSMFKLISKLDKLKFFNIIENPVKIINKNFSLSIDPVTMTFDSPVTPQKRR